MSLVTHCFTVRRVSLARALDRQVMGVRHRVGQGPYGRQAHHVRSLVNVRPTSTALAGSILVDSATLPLPWYSSDMSTTLSPSRPQPILGSVAQCLTPDVAKRILSIELEAGVQARVRELAEKANEGLLDTVERSEYEALIEDADLLGIFKSLARQALSR